MQAVIAALALFTLRDFDAASLHVTLPDFHNITLRYTNFILATEKGNPSRIAQASQLIDDLKKHAAIITEYEQIKADPRVTVTVDLFWIGLVFVRKGQVKEDFKVKY